MKQYLILSWMLLNSLAAFAQPEKRDIQKGNQLYNQQKYKEAEASYRNAVTKKAQPTGNFNLGDALYKQQKYAEAAAQFNQLAGAGATENTRTTGVNKQVLAGAYHNLGNSLLESKKLEESIEAYKKSLINNPKDDQTRYNLAYAQEKLKQQQQQNKDKKNKDGKNKDKNQDKKDQDNKKDQDKQDQKKQEQQQPNKLSKEDAQRMLDAMNNSEKQTQDKLKDKKLKGARVRISKDW